MHPERESLPLAGVKREEKRDHLNLLRYLVVLVRLVVLPGRLMVIAQRRAHRQVKIWNPDGRDPN